MNITLLGNCQTKALSWYIQQLDLDFDIKWIWTNIGMGNSARSQQCPFVPNRGRGGRHVPTVVHAIQARARLLESDYIIYQPIRPSRIKDFNHEDIQKYKDNTKLISIGCFYCKTINTRHLTDNKTYEERTGLLGMKQRSDKFSLDIQPHKIIEKHGIDAVATNNAYHPKTLYFLELVREICEKTGWNYYSDEQYNRYLKEGYPFG